MGMSYRRAWLLLDALNDMFAERVSDMSHGGTRGGGARLTPFGREVIGRYRAIEAALVSNFSAISDEQYVIDHHRWVVETDDAAVCLYRWSWHGLINGVPSKGTGRGTTVLARQASGWRVVHEHLSVGTPGWSPAA